MRFRKSPAGPGRVIDRRGAKVGAIGLGGGALAAIVILVFNLLSGGSGDAGGLLDALRQSGATAQPDETPPDPATDPDADLVRFLGDVLADSQGMWQQIFTDSGLQYRATDLVLFSGFTSSGCGGAPAQVGPHYCPSDERVYIDLDFFRALQDRFGAAGDTAQAYVLAHEVGHHVQHVMGIMEDVRSRAQPGSDEANELSIALELQADCFAGVWLSTLRTGASAAVLERGDLQEALDAAAAVGDDAIQRATTGRVDPETWTHGSSEQRLAWLERGVTTGNPGECDTSEG